MNDAQLPLNLAFVLPPIWLVAYSGHRPRAGDDARSEAALEACRASIRRELELLAARARELKGTIELVGGVAEGADVIFLETAAELGLGAHLILTTPVTDMEKGWALRASALLARTKSPESGWTAREMSGVDPDIYSEVNAAMLEVADVVLAVYAEDDENQPPLSGGTGDLLRVAAALPREIPRVVIDPRRPGALIEKRETLKRDEGFELLWSLNRELFALDPERLRRGRAGQAADIPDYLRGLDQVAVEHSVKFRRMLVGMLVLNASAATLLSIYSEFGGGLVSCGLLVMGLLLSLAPPALLAYVKHAASRRQWRRFRFAAELAASIHWKKVGLLDRLECLDERFDGKWRRLMLAVALGRQKETSAPSIEDPLREYRQGRIEGQRKYFEAQAGRVRKWYRVPSVGLSLTSALSMTATIIGLFAFGVVEMDTPPVKYSVAAATSLLGLSNLCAALMMALDAPRRRERYLTMSAQLEQLDARLELVPTPTARRDSVRRVEMLLGTELLEWSAAGEILDLLQ